MTQTQFWWRSVEFVIEKCTFNVVKLSRLSSVSYYS